MWSATGYSTGVFLLLSAGVAPAADGPDDARALQGTWDIVSLERGGAEVKPQPGTTMTVAGDKFAVKVGVKVIAAGTVRLDPTVTPRVAEMTYTEGLASEKGKTFRGIYRLDGDRWTFCRGPSPDQGPPTEFKTAKGGGGFLAVYERRGGR